MAMAKMASKITLDWSKLLGFDQITRAEIGEQASCGGLPAKVGSKVGSKIGGKPGIKPNINLA